MHELAEQLLFHMKAIWRYRWYAVVVAWIAAVGGWFVVYTMPDRYVAYTQVYVDTQSVLKPLMSGVVVNPDLDQIVAIVSQTMLNRPNLEKLIRMADLDIGLKTDQEREKLINRLSKDITIEKSKAISFASGLNDKEILYRISFPDENPRVAQRVVESLLELFVERTMNDNLEDAESAQRFINERLEAYRDKLTASENAIMVFKRRHLGLMPGEGSNYFARLVDAKADLRQAELDLKEAEDSAGSIRQQLAIASQDQYRPVEDGVSESAEPEAEIDVRIRALERKLDELQLQYTEQHPDIVALVPMIAKLKKQKEVEAKLLMERTEATAMLSGNPRSPAQAQDPVYKELKVALTKADATVAAMRARVAEHNRRYAELQGVANTVPQVEAEYAQLTRDYQANKARYDDLMKRSETAIISQDMETRDETMGFRVVDPPRLPLSPSEPNRLILMTLVFLAALGGGLGTAWLITQIRPVINDERKLKEVSGLPVLGTVVMAWTDAQKKRQNWGLVAFLTSFASLLSAYAAVIAGLILAA